MGHHCCSKQKVKRGLWSPEEDEKLVKYITSHGHGCWSSVPRLAGLQRCGKSCRLRWINYLRPDLKRGTFTSQEERVIIDVHRILGNRWAQIAKHLPGRTDNEVKNFWNSCIKKKLMAQGLDPKTHNLIPAIRPPINNGGGGGSNVSSFSQLNQYPLQPDSTARPFTISNTPPSIRNFDATKANLTDILQPAFAATLRPPHPNSSFPLHGPAPVSVSAFHYLDPSVLMGFKDQNPQGLLDYTNCSSSSLERADISPPFNCSSSSMEQADISPPFNRSEFMDDACMWGPTGNVVQPFEAPKQNGLQHGQVQAQAQVEMEMSYSSSPFDDLGLMDPELMPCGAFSGSPMEQLPWDC